jgi:hypothetical protein
VSGRETYNSNVSTATRWQLGQGVEVDAFEQGGLVVTSAALELPWQLRQGVLPGTAVVWGEEMFEVMSRATDGSVVRWTLEPWPNGSVARRVFALDEPTLAGLATTVHEHAVRVRRGLFLTLLLPFAGFAPTRLQLRWESEYGMRATLATVLGAWPELLLGVTGALQLMTLAGGGWWLPGPLHVIAYLAPILVIDGWLRVYAVVAQGKPLGSVFGLWLLLFVPAEAAPRAASVMPIAVVHERVARRLELQSPILRADWSNGGILRFRDDHWRLLGQVSHCAPWLYRFERVDHVLASEPPLRMAPPAGSAPSELPRGPGYLRLAFETVVFAVAPRWYQEVWAETAGYGAHHLTAVSAAIEIFGAGLNILGAGRRRTPWVIVDAYFLVEGFWRLLVAIGTRKACGSALGLPLLSYYRRWRPAHEGAEEQ